MRRPVSKYRAKRTTVDGVTFHSMKEAARYQELKLLEKAGEVRQLCLQDAFCLDVGHLTIGKYVSDFSYMVKDGRGGWKRVWEDVKGFKTPLYKWKKKHVEAQYGIEIREV